MASVSRDGIVRGVPTDAQSSGLSLDAHKCASKSSATQDWVGVSGDVAKSNHRAPH